VLGVWSVGVGRVGVRRVGVGCVGVGRIGVGAPCSKPRKPWRNCASPLCY
jgi:hypothetical protein